MTRPMIVRLTGIVPTLLVVVASSLAAQQTVAHEVPTQPITLADAARIAARQTASVEAARFRVGEAGARVRQRRSELLPSVTGNATESGHTLNSATFGFDFPAPAGEKPLLDPAGQIIGPVNTIDLRGQLRLPIYDAAARARVTAAQAAVDASNADVTTASQVAAVNAASAYVRAERADAQLLARSADSTLAADLLRIAQEQLRAGVGVALDVTRAQSQLATVRAQLIAARNERDRSRLDLIRAMNLPIDTRIVLADSLATETPATSLDEQTATANALRNRPDLRAAEEQIRAAERQVQATRAERLPSVNAFGDEGVIAKNGNGNYLNTYTWGVQLSVPIFEGFRREGRTEELELVRREAEMRRRDIQEQARVEVRQALLDLASAREQVDAARERLRLTEQELSQARDRFRAGVSGNADVITASLSLNGARTQLNDALASWQLARIGLARSQGTASDLR